MTILKMSFDNVLGHEGFEVGGGLVGGIRCFDETEGSAIGLGEISEQLRAALVAKVYTIGV